MGKGGRKLSLAYMSQREWSNRSDERRPYLERILKGAVQQSSAGLKVTKEGGREEGNMGVVHRALSYANTDSLLGGTENRIRGKVFNLIRGTAWQ